MIEHYKNNNKKDIIIFILSALVIVLLGIVLWLGNMRLASVEFEYEIFDKHNNTIFCGTLGHYYAHGDTFSLNGVSYLVSRVSYIGERTYLLVSLI